MTRDEFDRSLGSDNPPESMPAALQALWHDHAGNWERAHGMSQEIPGRTGPRIHAYLHRKEGDISNARYWYGRAEDTMPNTTLDEEWSFLVDEIIDGRL